MTDAKDRPAGPPTAGGPEFLIVGKIRRPHGVKGDVVVEIYTDYPERLLPQKTVFLGEKHVKATIDRRRQHNEGLLLGFKGISSPEQAGRYRNQVLSILASDTPGLPGGRYFFHELLDSKVVDDSGKILGTLTEIIETGANDVYVIKGQDGRELLLPAIADVVLNVDLEAKIIKVHLLPGLESE